MIITKTTDIVIIPCYWSSNGAIGSKIIDAEEYLTNTINSENILMVDDFNTTPLRKHVQNKL